MTDPSTKKEISKVYCHFGNGGFCSTLYQETGEYPGIEIKFGINHMGVINSEITVSNNEFEKDFLTREQLLEMSEFFIKAAEIVRENEDIWAINKKKKDNEIMKRKKIWAINKKKKIMR